ncbi:MAG TPA: ferritin-like domain-containing protein [Thermoanaerobaculia bacterium]|jgi:ferritin-like metal-binding protein YciE|nr:ferritin-like domain-containing protein [Thermoanaerobaculia bacterium]
MELTDLQQLFVHELKDIYSAEHQILKALPKMIKAASNDDLSTALEEHRQVTEKQVERLETVLREIDENGRGQKCKGMEGLLEEGSDLLKEDASAEVLDAGIIAAAQKVEHYEIAAYGTLVSFARRLGHAKAATLLEQSLAEEKEADQKLTEVAESSVNNLAA